MNARITSVIIAALLILSVGANATAAGQPDSLKPWELDGSLTLRATDEQGVGSDRDYRLNLTATKELLPNLTFKTTLTSFREKVFPTSDSLAEDAYLDQYSLKYAWADRKSSLLVGKDDLLFGNGLIMGDNLKNITFATTVDKLDIQLSTFKNKYVADALASSAGASVQTSWGKLLLGASYIKQNDDSFKNWSLNASYPIGAVKLAAEFTKNTAAAADQKAYCLTAVYGGLEHQGDTRFTLGYARAEKNALPGYTSLDLTNAADYRGPTYAVSHQLTATSILTLEHNHLRDMSDADASRTRLTYSITF